MQLNHTVDFGGLGAGVGAACAGVGAGGTGQMAVRRAGGNAVATQQVEAEEEAMTLNDRIEHWKE